MFEAKWRIYVQVTRPSSEPKQIYCYLDTWELNEIITRYFVASATQMTQMSTLISFQSSPTTLWQQLSPDRSVLITIITWHFQLHLMNVSILRSKYKYSAWSECPFACYSHCYVMRCPLTPYNVHHQETLCPCDARSCTCNIDRFNFVETNFP